MRQRRFPVEVFCIISHGDTETRSITGKQNETLPIQFLRRISVGIRNEKRSWRHRGSVRDNSGISHGDTEAQSIYGKQNETLPIQILRRIGLWNKKRKTAMEAPWLRERQHRNLARRHRDTERHRNAKRYLLQANCPPFSFS